jgi:hypothetical protein
MDTKAFWFPCVATLCAYTWQYTDAEKWALSMIPLGENNWKLQALNFPGLCPMCLFS